MGSEQIKRSYVLEKKKQLDRGRVNERTEKDRERL